MLQPIRTEPYKFNGVPLTDEEKKRLLKFGEKPKQIRGTFRYQGVKGKRTRTFVFVEDTKKEDGVYVAGRTVTMTPDDFEIGLDLGKIKGRAKKVRRPKS